MLELIKTLSTFELAVWFCFIMLVISHLFYQLISYRKLLFYKPAFKDNTESASLPPVSVIICANNEGHNLKKFLPLILEQNYPEFQVVVVNDCSEDDSEEILEQLKSKYKKLYYTTVKRDPIYRHGKKLAVTLGIKAAKYEHLIFTDADCYPTGNKWLRSMARHFSDKKQIIVGVSPYKRQKSFLGQVVGYETLQTAISYISSALRGHAYMGVGRNMGYTKSLFYDNNGFSGHTHILSGDDDLFINKAANKENVAIEMSSDSIMESIPETHWNEWFKQKKRHLTTGKFYKRRHKFRFSIEGAQGFFFYCTFIILLIFSSYPLIVLGIYIFRSLISSIFRLIATKKLNMKKGYFFEALWLDIIVPMIRTTIMFNNLLKPQKFTWR